MLVSLLLSASAVLWSSPASALVAASSTPTQTGMAFIINGGMSPGNNECDFYSDLQKADQIFPLWEIQKFSGDQAGRKLPNAILCDAQGGLTLDVDGVPVLTRREIPGALPSDRHTIFSTVAKAMHADDTGKPVVLYFTDHGDNEKGGAVLLWNNDYYLASDLSQFLNSQPRDRQIILIQDHCYASKMLKAAWKKNGALRGNVCGFAVSTELEQAASGQSLMGMAAISPEVRTWADLIRKMNQSDDIGATATKTSEILLEKYLVKNRQINPSGFTNLETIPGSAIHMVSEITDPTTTVNLKSSLSASDFDLIQKEIGGLANDLQNAVGKTEFAKVDINEISVRQIEKAIGANEIFISRSDAEQVQKEEQLEALKEAFAREKMGVSKYNMFVGYGKLIANLKNKLSGKQTPARRAALEKELATNMVIFEPLDIIHDNYSNAAYYMVPGFVKFVEKNAPKALPTVLRLKSLQDSEGSLYEVHHPLNVLALVVRKAEALSLILRRGELTELQDYIALLRCENVAIGK